jgi:hypothetical protein
MNREQVIEFILHASPNDLLHILDATIDPVASILGGASGIEDDRHALLLQILESEKCPA